MASKPDYLLIGHMTADLTPAGRILGGTVSYAARTAAAFGLKVGVLTSARVGELLLDHLYDYVDDIVIIPSLETSTFENIYRPDGRQQMIRGVAASLRYADIPQSWRNAPLVHFGPLTGEIDPQDMFPLFDRSITMLTAQGMLREWGEDGVVRFKRWRDAAALQKLDWLVLSEEDIAPAPELESEYAQIVDNFVLTRAERGGTYYANGLPRVEYDTPQVEVIHPTGAGDVFASALLCSLHLLGGDVKRSLRVAAMLGAQAVTREGWNGAPTADEVQAALDASEEEIL